MFTKVFTLFIMKSIYALCLGLLLYVLALTTSIDLIFSIIFPNCCGISFSQMKQWAIIRSHIESAKITRVICYILSTIIATGFLAIVWIKWIFALVLNTLTALIACQLSFSLWARKPVSFNAKLSQKLMLWCYLLQQHD